MNCILCDQKIFGHGHNAEPLSHGRCCGDCLVDVIMDRASKMVGNDTPDIKTIAEVNRENRTT